MKTFSDDERKNRNGERQKTNRAEIYAELVEIYAEPVKAKSNRAETKSNRAETKSLRSGEFSSRVCGVSPGAYSAHLRNRIDALRHKRSVAVVLALFFQI